MQCLSGPRLSVNKIVSLMPPLCNDRWDPPAWMCCSWPARPCPPACTPGISQLLHLPPITAYFLPIRYQTAPTQLLEGGTAGIPHCAAHAAMSCPHSSCFCNPLKVAVPMSPPRSHCCSSGRGRVPVCTPVLVPGQTKGTLALLRTPVVSSTSQTLGKGFLEVLGTAWTGRASEEKGELQLYYPCGLCQSTGKPNKPFVRRGLSLTRVCGWRWQQGVLSPPAPPPAVGAAHHHLHHLSCPPGFLLGSAEQVQGRSERLQFIVGANQREENKFAQRGNNCAPLCCFMTRLRGMLARAVVEDGKETTYLQPRLLTSKLPETTWNQN